MLVVYHGEAGPRQRRRFDEVAAANGLTIEICPPHGAERLAALLPEMAAWWHVLTPITSAHLDRAPSLRIIQKWGVGVNTIDVAGATERGIAVANMAGSNAAAVAESALMLMLAVLRRLPAYNDATVAGRGWMVPAAMGEECRELAGATVGLVGYGDIARRLGAVLSALGAVVVHHSRRADRPGWMPLDELLRTSDVVSLHVPLTTETELLIDADRIAIMKPGAVLVNTARGGLVDLDAVAEALVEGRLGGAGLDVFPDEPWTPDQRIASHPGVVVTPHVAWLTWETLERSLDLAVANVVAIRDGRPITDRVG